MRNDMRLDIDQILQRSLKTEDIELEFRWCIEMLETHARRWYEASTKGDRLEAMQQFLLVLEGMVKRDVSQDVRGVFLQIQLGIDILRMGQCPPQFAPAESDVRGNYSINEWLLHAFAAYFYKVFRHVDYGQQAADERTEQLLSRFGLKPSGTIRDTIHNFRSGKESENQAKEAATQYFLLLEKHFDIISPTLNIENADMYCEHVLRNTNVLHKTAV